MRRRRSTSVCPLAIAAVAAASLTGCVVGGRARPSRPAVQSGPIVVEAESAATHLQAERRGVVRLTGARGDAPSKDAHYLHPHVHWSGVDHTVVDGQWERRDPPYVWRLND